MRTVLTLFDLSYHTDSFRATLTAQMRAYGSGHRVP